MLGLWKRIAKDKHDIELSWEEAVISVLADGYEVSYGARSVKHESERKVVSALAEGKSLTVRRFGKDRF